jgi:hypothetical protein
MGNWRNIAITLNDPQGQFLKRVMAFHEKAGPGQVDFDLPFLKFAFPSWQEGVQSGPERSRARSLRRQRTLDGEDRSVTIPLGRKERGSRSRFFVFPRVLLCAPIQPCRHALPMLSSRNPTGRQRQSHG